MMVKILDGPSQVTEPLVKCGMTVIVAITGIVPLFTAVKGRMLPLPLAPKPMVVVLLAQVYVVVPDVFKVLKATSDVVELLQTSWLPG